MNFLVTGSAGFIGAAVTMRLLQRGDVVIGVDNLNDYYDVALKKARLERLLKFPNYVHYTLDISDSGEIKKIFSKYNPSHVVNLAAQAGVRYSIENPMAFISSNLVGFANILEGCRSTGVEHLVYASSSSVYGANTKLPFAESDAVDHPVSLYGATKRANEIIAHSYSELYRIPSTGLRFFTVYGPWARPDMALFKFTKAMIEKKEIPVFNFGKHRRDFTYVDDIVEGVLRVIDRPPQPHLNGLKVEPVKPCTSDAPWRVYNIGSSNPVELGEYITALEESLGIEANKKFLPMQAGDVLDTFADMSDFIRDFGYKPATPVKQGVRNFVKWYREYYHA